MLEGEAKVVVADPVTKTVEADPAGCRLSEQ